MGRKNSYKKNFIPPEAVPFWWNKVNPEFECYLQNWKTQKLHPSLLCSQYLNTFLKKFYSKPISSHYKSARITNSVSHDLPKELLLWDQYLFRGVKAGVNRTLLSWFNGQYPLELFFYVPEPLEVLKQQALGKRCVSCILTLPTEHYVQGDRDPWSFLIHDLIHADQFYFQNSSLKEQQVLCYFFLECYQNQLWQPLWSANPDARSDFEYIFSDMNSHPVHMLKVLKSNLVRYNYLDKWSKECNSLISHLIQPWWHEFLKLNTTEENSNTHQELMMQLMKVDIPT